jgi:hypothetical protein
MSGCKVCLSGAGEGGTGQWKWAIICLRPRARTGSCFGRWLRMSVRLPRMPDTTQSRVGDAAGHGAGLRCRRRRGVRSTEHRRTRCSSRIRACGACVRVRAHPGCAGIRGGERIERRWIPGGCERGRSRGRGRWPGPLGGAVHPPEGAAHARKGAQPRQTELRPRSSSVCLRHAAVGAHCPVAPVATWSEEAPVSPTAAWIRAGQGMCRSAFMYDERCTVRPSS